MPFKSKAQRAYMHINHPGIAKRWEKHTPKDVKLPQHVKKADLGIDPVVSRKIDALQNGTPLGYQRRGFSLRHLLPTPSMSGRKPIQLQSQQLPTSQTTQREVNGDPYPSQDGTSNQYSPHDIISKTATDGEITMENAEKSAAVGKSQKSDPMVYRPINRRIYGPANGIKFQKQPGIKNASQVILSAFMGGVLNTFCKNGSFPDIDPNVFFSELVKTADTDCTVDEIEEVRQEFLSEWGRV